jgi:phosphatidylserine/phosphatidylglycerophosphate/cardiolipin synthase-like enzyme
MKRIVLLYFFFIFLVPQILFADTQVYFSPNGGCQEAVITEISHAQKSIDIAMYSFTSREIAQALIEARGRNVKIRVVLDKAQRKERYSKSRYLISKGIDAKYHIASGLMHNKFAVIDGKELLTGSFNWTASANKKNEENLLIMTNQDVIQKYEDRFEYLWNGSSDADAGDEQYNKMDKE